MTTEYTSEELHQLHEAYFQELTAGDYLHKPLQFDEFLGAFVESSGTLAKAFFADIKHSSFLAGVRDLRNNKIYITFVFVPEKYRRQGVASKLLDRFEQFLAAHSNSSEFSNEIELSFLNPVNLTWYIPETNKHDHPNAPGVDIGSAAYYFFQNRGFRNFAYQNSYHVNLEAYEIPDKIKQIEAKLLSEGVSIEIYDKHSMDGLEELLIDLDSELWTQELMAETSDAGKNRPIIVPVYENKIYGFTGPLDVQESGRGYFAGIAVHSAFRGRGIAKVLFSYLCSELQGIGAEYMTLFTGDNNPARNIYEASGFKLVNSWADMRKTWRKSR